MLRLLEKRPELDHGVEHACLMSDGAFRRWREWAWEGRKAFGRVHWGQFMRNTARFLREPSEEDFLGDGPASPFFGKRVLLIAAGPTYREEWGKLLLPRAPDLVVCAVDRAYCGSDVIDPKTRAVVGRIRGLAEMGVKVDYVFIIDPITGDDDRARGRAAVRCPARVPGRPTILSDVNSNHRAMRAFANARDEDGRPLDILWFQAATGSMWARARIAGAEVPVSSATCREDFGSTWNNFLRRPRLNGLASLALQIACGWFWRLIPDGLFGWDAGQRSLIVRYLPAYRNYNSSSIAALILALDGGAREIAFLGYDFCEPSYAISEEEANAILRGKTKFEESRFKELLRWHIPARRGALPKNLRDEGWAELPGAKADPRRWKADSLVLPLGVNGENRYVPMRPDLLTQHELATRLCGEWARARARLGALPDMFVQCSRKSAFGFDLDGNPIEGVFRHVPAERFVRGNQAVAA